MRKFIKKISHKSGLPPGTLVHIGTEKVEKTEMTVIDYALVSALSHFTIDLPTGLF